jgi:hypothetical protein
MCVWPVLQLLLCIWDNWSCDISFLYGTSTNCAVNIITSSLQIEFLYTWNHVRSKTQITWTDMKGEIFFSFSLKQVYSQFASRNHNNCKLCKWLFYRYSMWAESVLKIKQKHGGLSPGMLLIISHMDFSRTLSGYTDGSSKNKHL